MPKTIVLVDDDYDLRQVLKESLQIEGYTVNDFNDAAAAIGWIQADTPPDLLITDLSMPNMTGDKLILEVKKLFPNLKIILISGLDDSEQKKLFKGVSCDVFIKKPIGLSNFIKEVNNFFRNKTIGGRNGK